MIKLTAPAVAPGKKNKRRKQREEATLQHSQADEGMPMYCP